MAARPLAISRQSLTTSSDENPAAAVPSECYVSYREAEPLDFRLTSQMHIDTASRNLLFKLRRMLRLEHGTLVFLLLEPPYLAFVQCIARAVGEGKDSAKIPTEA